MAQFYKHTQNGQKVMVFGMIAVLFAMSALYYDLLEKAPLRNSAETAAYYALVASGLLGGLLLVWVTAMMSALTVIVEDGFIRIQFGPGAWRKKFALAQVTSAKPVKSSFWNGWGIHYTGKAWLYNVAGYDAVEITLKNGKKNWIGTDEPDKLTTVINGQIQQSS